MTDDEIKFYDRLTKLKERWHATKRAQRMIEDQIDWFELAEILIKKGDHPLCALLAVDRDCPSLHYSYKHQIRKISVELA